MNKNFWTVLGCSALVVATALACKKKEDEKPTAAAKPTAKPAATEEKKATIETHAPVAFSDYKDKEYDTVSYKLTVKESNLDCDMGSSFREKKLKEDEEKLVAMKVTIESKVDKGWFFGTSGMKLKDDEGHVFNVYYLSSSKKCEPPLKSSKIEKGEKIAGWVFFKVKEKLVKSGGKLVFQYRVRNRFPQKGDSVVKQPLTF